MSQSQTLWIQGALSLLLANTATHKWLVGLWTAVALGQMLLSGWWAFRDLRANR